MSKIRDQGIGSSPCSLVYLPLPCRVSQREALPLVDLLYRLASGCEHGGKLSVGGVPLYPNQLPAFLHIQVEEQIEAVPVGVVPSFTLVGTAGEKRGDDVRERCHDSCIHAAKVHPSDLLPMIY